MRAYTKNLIRTIFNNMRRYLAILSIVALGVAFFVGLRSTSPDMNATLDLYFDEQNVFDIRVLTNLGLSDESIEELRNTRHVSTVMPAYYCDEFVSNGEQSYLMRFHSLDLKMLRDGSILNKPALVEGRFPESADECVIESRYFSAMHYNLGDQITVFTGDDTDIFDDLSCDKFTIVGTVDPPLYITPNYGASNKGNGSIDSLIYIPNEAFALEIYTEAYVKFDSLTGYSRFEAEYETHRDSFATLLEPVADSIAQERYDSIIIEANEKIADAKIEIANAREELADAEQKLIDAEIEIVDNEKLVADSQVELDDGIRSYRRGVSELSSQQAEFNRQISDAEQKLADGDAELTAAEIEAAQNRLLLNEGYAQLELQKAGFVEGVRQALESAGIVDIEVSYEIIAGWVSAGSPFASPDIIAACQQIENAKAQLDENSALLSRGEAVLAEKRAELAEGQAVLAAEKEAGQAAISSGWSKLYAAKRKLDEGQSELDDAIQELADARIELEDGWREYNEKSAEAEDELANAEADIADAEEKIADISEPKSYVLSLDTNIGFVGFSQDSKRIDSVGYVFPLIFFLVAALVTMTNMLRIVEDDRSTIGVLKALGYGRFAIFNKYLVYALSVSLPGALLGVVIGYQLFPSLIFNQGYRILYIMPEIVTPIQADICAMAVIAAVASVILPTVYVCYNEMMASPAALMRPRTPRSGKRVFLERIPFLWNRFNFFVKVTSRNILRYKKRFFMTVIGIAGCTALIITGYGISDSIKYIAIRQFSEIYTYDFSIELKDNISENERSELEAYLDGTVDSYTYYYRNTYEVAAGGSPIEVSVMISEDHEGFADFIRFRDPKTREIFYFENDGIVITQKLGMLLDISPGDTLILRDGDNNEYSMIVSAIAENYVMHNVYMTQNAASAVFGEVPESNIIVSGIDEMSEDIRNALSTELLADFDINGLSFSEDILDYYTDMVNSLNFVVIVLIISAALLAFIVLFSLTAINIDERARELATLKVLGFYKHEMSSYIFRENAALTVIGTLIGLFLGIILHRFVIDTVELDFIMFSKEILPMSFVYSALLTFLFSAIVNLVMNRSINNINMVESLKSVE